jgi:hypothetical protein
MFCVSFDLCYKRLDTLAFLVICINCFVSKLREGKRFCLFFLILSLSFVTSQPRTSLSSPQ